MGAVWEGSRHSGSELLMLLAFADFSDDQGNSYPAVRTVAAKCRMQPRNANYILKALQDSGELQVRPNEGPKGTNRYRIVLEALKGVQSSAGGGVQSGAGVQSSAGLQPTARTPATECAKPLQPSAAEPSLNRQEPSEERERAPRASKRPVKTSMPKGFCISERVRSWAMTKGFDRLDQHLEAFVGKAVANGYTYVDWDQAFMNAVSGDWAKIRSDGAQGNGRRPVLDSVDIFAGAR